MKLISYAKILRSKNAGPLYITFDLIFEDRQKMEYVMNGLQKAVIFSKNSPITVKSARGLALTFLFTSSIARQDLWLLHHAVAEGII